MTFLVRGTFLRRGGLRAGGLLALVALSIPSEVAATVREDSSASRGEPEKNPDEGEYVPPPPPSSKRLRVGIASGAAFGRSWGRDAGGGLGTSFELALGQQFDRHWGVYALGSIATLLFSWDVSAFGIVEYNPVSWLSLGTGVGYDGAVTVLCFGGCGSSYPWNGLTVPFVLGFEIFGVEGWRLDERRSVLRLQFVGAPGIDVVTGSFGAHVATSVGVAWK